MMNYLTSIIFIILFICYNVIAQNPLLCAIFKKDLTTAHGLIANPKTNINEKIYNDKCSHDTETTALKFAIQLARIDIIKFLLQRKDLAINAPMGGKENLTPLQQAFSPSNKEVIKTLLTSPNIDLNVEIGGRPLLTAVVLMKKDNIATIKAILSNKNFHLSMLYQKDSRGKTPIDTANKKMAKFSKIVKLFEHKAKKLSSTYKDHTSKVSINHAEKNPIPNKLASTNNDYTSKAIQYLSSTKDDYTSKTHGQSKLELDSPYYKKRHEFLNKPETKQKELKTELVVEELHHFQKHNKVPTHIKWHSLDIDEKCVFIWTTGVYDSINKALRDDKDNYGLNYWMPCIAGIVNYLKKTKSKEIISYRGTSLTIVQDKLYKLDSKNKELVTVVNFLSTSKVERRALHFPLGDASEGYVKVLFVITVPENAVAADIEHLSNFPSEYEVLLKPFTVFRVNKYITEGKPRPYIYVEIVDCRKHDCSRAYFRHM